MTTVREVLEQWKSDQHPYMSAEIKQLIREIEVALRQSDSVNAETEGDHEKQE